MRLGRAIYMGACCALLTACVGVGEASGGTYVVGPGDTLYSIAWRHDLDYRELARWNAIGGDFHIVIGQTLRLAPYRLPTDTGRARPSTMAEGAAPRRPNVVWTWPVLSSGTPQAVAGGGILLKGYLGQEVRAAAAGRVVYTGNGIRGYGNLIIIKHAEGMLSAYAHNREMLVHDGDEVALGQPIARMGEGGNGMPELYFEIRENGRAVDSLRYLPMIK